MRRFLFLSIPLLILTMGLFHFVVEMLGWSVDPYLLAPGGGMDLPGWVRLATWMLEALGLSALFLLIAGRDHRGDRGGPGGSWTAGLLAGWIAWVFRGPLLVVTVVGTAGLPPEPWWTLSFSWWVLYSLCGLLLGALAAVTGLGRTPPEAVPAGEA